MKYEKTFEINSKRQYYSKLSGLGCFKDSLKKVSAKAGFTYIYKSMTKFGCRGRSTNYFMDVMYVQTWN